MIVANIDDGEGMEQLGEGCGDVSELELWVARVEELGAELEFERRMRWKVEALNEALAAELADEWRRGEAAEAECARMRTLEEVGEERRMLRVAELWREERVQMKFADARAAVEEKLRKIADDAGAGHLATADATACGCNCRSSGGGGILVGKSSPASQHGQQSPVSGNCTGERPPSADQGIRGVPEGHACAAARRGDVDLVSNLECQWAQLRVLMRHRSPAVGMGLVGAPENLVVQ